MPRLALPFAVLFAACVPTETIEIPDHIDWVAVVDVQFESGRMRRASSFEAELPATERPSWVV